MEKRKEGNGIIVWHGIIPCFEKDIRETVILM